MDNLNSKRYKTVMLLKYFLLVFVIILLPLIPAFAQDTKNSTNSTINVTNINHTNSINQTEPNILIPTIIEWHVGIFAIIGGAITLIGILLTVRFVFIDKAHEDLIKKLKDSREKFLEEQEHLFDTARFGRNNVRWLADQISGIDIALAELRRYKKDNGRAGTYIDTISMMLLFVVGGLGTTGLFESQFYILPIIIGAVVVVPITHFIIQLRHTKHSV